MLFVSNIDTLDNRPLLESCISICDYYELTKNQALLIITELKTVISNWVKVARTLSISNAEIDLMRPAFLLHPQPKHSSTNTSFRVSLDHELTYSPRNRSCRIRGPLTP